MNSKIQTIATNGRGIPREMQGNVLTLGDVVIALSEAVTTLQNLKDSETNHMFKNFELNFPRDGIDFYKAIKLYEINLIKQALRSTRGHQARAAKLLKLRTSTLNSIIKRHKIRY